MVVLSPYGQFSDSATIAFGERYDLILGSSTIHEGFPSKSFTFFKEEFYFSGFLNMCCV